MPKKARSALIDLPDQINRVRSATDVRLQALFADKVAAAGRIDPVYRRLLTDMAAFIERGGKRLRPFLTYVGYRAAGGRDERAIMTAAAAIELFHNFLLIHDDIMDDDKKRYNGPNIAGLYERRLSRRRSPHTVKLAESVALLAGDINAGLAYEMLADSGFSDARRISAIKRLTRTMFEVAGGQLMDISAVPLGELNLRRTLKLARYKTASYSIESPLQIGAVLAGGNSKLLDGLAEYARGVGIAFQLVDDMLAFYADAATLGKPQLTDLRGGKPTVLIYYALRFADANDSRYLHKIYGLPTATRQDFRRVRRIMDLCGARAKTAGLAAEYASRAAAIADGLAVPDETKQLLAGFADYCVQREF